ncbi:MAG: hypothetical protein P1U34_06075 [Coxiellaceae bacterium]|nr:hypothetical protein [Coxiellaceae bacterium]
MRRSIAEQRASALAACSAAEYEYNNALGKFGRLFSSDSYKDLAKQLATATNVIVTCIDWLKGARTEWNSYASKTFESFFLRELEKHEAYVYKAVIGQTYEIVFLDNKDDTPYVELYRGDSRSGPDNIFTVGFASSVSLERSRDRNYYFCSDGTSNNGVSTSKYRDQAAGFPRDYYGIRYVYTLRFNGHAISDPRALAVDIVATRKKQGGSYRQQLAEVNFMTGVPFQFIYSVSTSSGVIQNPSFTGEFEAPTVPLYRVVAPLPHEVLDRASSGGSAGSEPKAEAPTTDASVPGAAAAPPVAPAPVTAPPAVASSYVPPGSVTIGRYACTINVYKGQKGYMHLVFDDATTANAFIQTEDLRAERDPTGATYKKPDTRRYSGKAMVRLSQSRYALLASAVTELPGDVSNVPTAPAYRV